MAYRRGNAYYRSRKAGGHVVTDYLGTGEAGRLAAQADNEQRRARRVEREHFLSTQQADRELDEAAESMGRFVAMLRDAELLCNGYHTHKGQWRRLRTNVNL